ncbi:hypothetical protein ACFVVM_10290 [Nocardia sp. NPDC058176]|uniref:hypothetical protein n=1 Tax=Nocardia sp. NPDC058176 TaxID=3346368 RepID=UPI0036DC265C
MGRTLLEDVATLSIPQRMRKLALTARQLAGTPELDRLLAQIAEDGRYGRRTAIYLAMISGAPDYPRSHLDSPDPATAGWALTASIRLGIEPAAVLDRIPVAARSTRQSVYRALGAGGHAQLADALLPVVRARFGDGEAARVLPSCSAAVIAAWLPDLAYAVPSWTTLCRRQIGVVFEFVTSRAPTASRAEWRELWSWLTAQPHAAAEFDADRLLALAAAAVEQVSIESLNPVVGALARHDPRAVARLILHPSGHGRNLAGKALWQALRALPDEELRELYLACRGQDRRRFLRVFPPSRRAALAAADLVRPGISPAAVDVGVLDELPGPARYALARELLARPGAEVPEVADRLTARLPWPEAKPALAVSIRRPTADERAVAYPLLVTAAVGSRDPRVVTELLGLLAGVRNERDPVRNPVLRAVAAIPMSLWRTEHLPGLEQLTSDALQARDRSWTTSSAVVTLAHTLFVCAGRSVEPAFTETALRIFTHLTDLSRAPSLYGLHRDLPPGAEHRLFAALAPRLAADAARDRWDLCLSLATGLEHRAYDIPELQRLLVRACAASSDSTVRHAVELALAAPATRDAHLDELLAEDRSLSTLPLVQELISLRRTDLLDGLLDTRTPGRFQSPDVVFVPMFLSGFARWSAHHLDRYARLLDDHARGRETPGYEQLTAVRQLGRLPGSLARLTWFADNGEFVVREAALTALGGSDEPERAITVLSRRVDDDRARVAVDGIARCARSIPPERLSTVLAPLLNSRKVTAVKEGIRVLAALHAPDAVPIIGELATRTDAHRDVRRAAVFATRYLLEHDEAWSLLAEAAADPEVASAILDIGPALLPIPQRRRFAALVRDLAAQPDPRLAGPALDALARWRRWAAPGTDEVIVDRLTDLTVVGLWRSAVRALLSGVEAGADPAGLLSAVDRLRGDEFGTVGRDLPAQQRLSTLLAQLTATVRDHDEALSVAVPVAALLADDPLRHEQVIDLTLATVRWHDSAEAVAAIDRAARYATGALVTRPAQQLTQRLTRDLDTAAPDPLHATATELTARPTASTALAALTLVTHGGRTFGWTPPWTDLLISLRTHPDVDVRRSAYTVFTTAE